MPAQKRVLIALRLSDFNRPDALKGLQSYLLTHPSLNAHFCLLTAEMGAVTGKLRMLIERFRPHGVLAHVIWKRSELDLPPGTTLVNLDDDLPPEYPTVSPDQKRAGEVVAEHLLEQDLASYAFATLFEQYHYARQRWEGYQGRLAAAGCASRRFGPPVRDRRGPTADDEALLAWVAQLPKPAGVHAVEMQMAIRVLWTAQELGLRVPEDLALVAGADVPVMSLGWDPPVSAVDIDFSRVEYERLRLLDSLMRGKRPPTAPLLIPPNGIVARRSSDVRGTRDPEIARVRDAIRARAHLPTVVKELLSVTDLSRSALERRFEKRLGHSLYDEIVLAHLERAKRLLRETNLPVTKVAEQSGYASYPVFAVAFRKHTGMTAGEFRRKCQETEIAPTTA